MPLQHIHPRMLELMRRETSSEHIETLIARIRAGIPGIAIRTTFIVGFPARRRKSSPTCSISSSARGSSGWACSLTPGGRVPRSEDGRSAPDQGKQARYKKAMKLQQKIAAEVSAAQVGRTLRAIVDQPLVARAAADAPDIDGRILLTKPAPVGEFIDVRITGMQVYDLIGEPLPSPSLPPRPL
jgi:ribosomal protein S12 methylthiotransferase